MADKTPPEAVREANPQPSASEGQIEALRGEVRKQQAQIDQLLSTVQKLQEKLEAADRSATPTSAAPPSVGTLASTTPVIPRGVETPAPSTISAAPPPQAEAEETSPLQLKVGSAYITPVGFMDFTSIWRSKDGGSGIGTNFAGIPYGSTTFQGNLSEFRLSMQNSRIGFRVDADVKGAHAIGYMESDFLGNNPGNVAVSSNSNTLRSRLYWVDVRKGAWEVLGGQTWSLMTPGRTGISPLPGDLFYSQDIDVNYQLGLFWGRIPELRVVYHAGEKAAFAVALDSPEQYAGGSAGGSLVTLPSGLSDPKTGYAAELNVGTNTLSVPNVAPDVIAKLALDPSKRVHFEIGGVERNFKLWAPPTGTTPAATFTAQGGGGFANLNVEVFKGFRVLTNNFVSDGGGRYIFGQAPDLIAHADGSISLVHADSTVTGFEYTHQNSLLYAYYGGLYVYRNTAVDTNGKLVGYGYAGAPSGQNKSVQEGTLGFTQTFWKNPKYGALALMGQYSYLTRDPWSIAAGQPNNANLNMVFINLRYTLPGSAPTLGK